MEKLDDQRSEHGLEFIENLQKKNTIIHSLQTYLHENIQYSTIIFDICFVFVFVFVFDICILLNDDYSKQRKDLERLITSE